MKILILGATGNLARLTATALTNDHPAVQLRLTSHRAQGRSLLMDAFPAAEVVAADWYDEATLILAVSGVDKVLMVTPDFVTDERVVTPNIIRAIRAIGEISQLLRFIAIPPGFTAAMATAEQLSTRCGAMQHVVAKPLLDDSGLPVTYVNAACWIMFNLPWFWAQDIKASRRLLMPAATDAPRQWISEHDIADVFAHILADETALHVGREYLLTGHGRYTYAEVAALVADVLGERVTYVDDDAAIRRATGDYYAALMTYFTHETEAYRAVRSTQTVQALLGRPQATLRTYVESIRDTLA